MTRHTIARFPTYGTQAYRVDRIEFDDGDQVFGLVSERNGKVAHEFDADCPATDAPALIRRAADMAASDLIGEMVAEGLIGHVCARCGLGFEDAASLPIHVADGTCDEVAADTTPDGKAPR
jgi:hypothetical protein